MGLEAGSCKNKNTKIKRYTAVLGTIKYLSTIHKTIIVVGHKIKLPQTVTKPIIVVYFVRYKLMAYRFRILQYFYTSPVTT